MKRLYKLSAVTFYSTYQVSFRNNLKFLGSIQWTPPVRFLNTRILTFLSLSDIGYPKSPEWTRKIALSVFPQDITPWPGRDSNPRPSYPDPDASTRAPTLINNAGFLITDGSGNHSNRRNKIAYDTKDCVRKRIMQFSFVESLYCTKMKVGWI